MFWSVVNQSFCSGRLYNVLLDWKYWNASIWKKVWKFYSIKVLKVYLNVLIFFFFWKAIWKFQLETFGVEVLFAWKILNFKVLFLASFNWEFYNVLYFYFQQFWKTMNFNAWYGNFLLNIFVLIFVFSKMLSDKG